MTVEQQARIRELPSLIAAETHAEKIKVLAAELEGLLQAESVERTTEKSQDELGRSET
jgi:hypothetical protein